MNSFLENWGKAAFTSVGFFWMALWAFILGYIISSNSSFYYRKKDARNQWGKMLEKECFWVLSLAL